MLYSDDQIKILEAVQASVKKHGVKMLASKLSITPQTLYADVDPKSIGRRTNKLGVLDWQVILGESKDLSSLDALEQSLGRIGLPVPVPSEDMTDKSWVEYCALVVKESGEAAAEVAKAIVDGHIDDTELSKCIKETYEAMEAQAALYLALKKLEETRNIPLY
jgi:hypothetical protein